MRIIRPNAGFIIPEKRFVDVGMPAANLTMRGRYRLTVRDRHGDAKRGTDWFPNIILNSGLNRWGSGGVISGAAIGTGSSTPDATQTGLDAQSTWTTTAGTGHNTVSASGVSPYFNSRIHVYRTALGALNGNYSEVGVGWATGQMFSRALILDGLGNPTTISVASDEQLDIEYELQVFPPLTDVVGTITIAGMGDVDIVGRAANVNATSTSQGWGVLSSVAPSLIASGSLAMNAALSVVTALPSGQVGAATSATTDAYSPGSLQRTGFVSYGTTGGNPAGGVNLSLAAWNGFSCFQYSYSPTIPKNSTKTLVLNYRVSWARRP